MNTAHPSSEVPIEVPPVREVQPQAVLRWLALGWRDMRASGAASLLHGAIVCAGGIMLDVILLGFWELLPGAITGFVLIGPFLATGLYAMSKRLEAGAQPSFDDVLQAWGHGGKCLFRFTLILILAGTAWVLFSVAMFHFFIEAKIEEPLDFLRYVLTQQESLFLLWTLLGGLGTALAFAVTVITVPLLIDRNVNTWLAIRTSVRAVSENPVTMVLWAITIMLLTGLSFLTLMLGFLVLYPLMGHASWHVYRELVDPSALPEHATAG